MRGSKIDSIQHGLASKLDFQAVVDLVGDKLREVFATGDIGIWWWDADTRTGHGLYVFEHGVRHHPAPYAVKPGTPTLVVSHIPIFSVIKTETEIYLAQGS